MSWRTRLVAICALAMQVTAPLAAYAVAIPGPALNDFCSVAKPVDRSPAKVPGKTPVERHALSHCAQCAGGSAMLALPASPVAVLVTIGAPSLRIAYSIAPSLRDAVIRPHARGPPLPA